jgi:hypothetical protein
MGSAVLREQVRCAMEVGASTLGDATRVNLTVGYVMGDATLGDVGFTLGALGGFCGKGAGGIEGLWMGVGGASGEECLLANVRHYGGVAK